MKKNINVGMVVVFTMSAVSSTKMISAETDFSSGKNLPNNNDTETYLNNDKINNYDNDKNDLENEDTELKITPIEKTNKINAGKIITERIYDKTSDDVISSSALDNKTAEFKLNFKTPDEKEDFSISNFENVSDVNTSGGAVSIGRTKVQYMDFNISKGDIVIKDSSIDNSIIVEQNGEEKFVNNQVRIMLVGTSDKNKISISENINADIVLNNISLSSDSGLIISNNAKINFKIIDNSINTIKNITNKGSLAINGKTGTLTTQELNGKVAVLGGVVTATKKCNNLSSFYVSSGSVNVDTASNVKYSEYKDGQLKLNVVKVNGINSSETVEVNMNGDAFVTRTDINGKLYLFLPNRDSNVVIKNKNSAYISAIEENGQGNYIAEEISEINRVDVELNQNINSDDTIDVTFKVKIPKELKYSDDFQLGIQCLENGWVLDDTVSKNDIAKFHKDSNGEYYEFSKKGLEPQKVYKCRVFSICNGETQFSDVMEFKTTVLNENKYDELKVSGLTKTFNSNEQNIDVETTAKYNVVYYQNGKRLDKSPVNVGTYVAKVIVNDDEHKYFEKNFEFTIEKATPIISEIPFASNVVIGKTLSASKFFGGKVDGLNANIDGIFKWKDDNVIIEKSNVYNAEFVSANNNYSNVELEVSVSVDDENKIEFIDNLPDKTAIQKCNTLILKTDAVSNDGKPLLYQWYKDGEPITDAISSIYVKSDISEDDKGEYYVIAKSIDGYSSASKKCVVALEEDTPYKETVSSPKEKKYSKGISIVYAEAETDSYSETESDSETTTEELFSSSETKENSSENKSSNVLKRFLNSKNKNKEQENTATTFERDLENTEGSSESTSETSSEEYEEYDDNGSSEPIKRITDNLLVDIYGKVTYPDDNTVVATATYPTSEFGTKKVYQLNEYGCFINVDSFNISGNQISVLTDRDFPLIVGGDTTFADVTNHWDSDDINFILSFGLMNGQGGGFNPDSNVTRGDFILALYNLSGKPECESEIEFSDVPTDSAYHNAVIWAYNEGLIQGKSDTEFGINLNVTREQAAVVISSYIEKMGLELSSGGNLYSDSENISSWAIDSVNKLGSAAIMGDLGYGRFEAKTFCSRADTATLLKKIIQYKINF